jgi:hypothetical protein
MKRLIQLAKTVVGYCSEILADVVNWYFFSLPFSAFEQFSIPL